MLEALTENDTGFADSFASVTDFEKSRTCKASVQYSYTNRNLGPGFELVKCTHYQ